MGYDLTEAVEAGTRELHSLRCCDGEGPLACTPSEMTDDESDAANAIRAALPHLEQQIRERVAAKALREAADDDEMWVLTDGEQRLYDANTPYYMGVSYGFRIARKLLKDRANQYEQAWQSRDWDTERGGMEA